MKKPILGTIGAPELISAATKGASGSIDVEAYEKSLSPTLANVCGALRREIEKSLPQATGKIWHGAPVWFLGEHPIVAYSVKGKTRISLLFWNGQAFDEPTLKRAGKFKAAEALFESVAEIDERILRRQLKKAKTMLWDYAGVPMARRPKSPSKDVV